jgi:hypothetical protein
VGRIRQESTIRQEISFNAFGRCVCCWERIIIRQKGFSTAEGGNVWDCVMTWTGYKEGSKLMMDTKPT